MKRKNTTVQNNLSPREQAYYSLLAIDREGAFSNLEIQRVLSRSLFSKPDAHLYTALVYGVLQNEILLDERISAMIKSGTRLDFEIREILRIAAFQMLMMNRIPSYAAISEAVELCGKIKPKAKGFVNGVLRNMARKSEQLKRWRTSDYKDTIQALSVRTSVPKPIVEIYVKAFGGKASVRELMAVNEPSLLTIRANGLKTSRDALLDTLAEEGVEGTRTAISPSGIKIANASVSELNQTQAHCDGLFTIQDQGAMLIVEALSPKAGERILDMCAAPGGKTTYIAEMTHDKGTITARDIYPSRLKLIDNQAAQLGIQSIITEAFDGTMCKPSDREQYDRVLLDAPCSGLGIIRRKPEIRYRFDFEKQRALINIQRKMLINAIDALKPGGTLVYSTCTVDPKENAEQIHWLCRQTKEIVVLETRQISTADDQCDGFYYAKLIKNA